VDELSFAPTADPLPLDLLGVPLLTLAVGACRCGQTYRYAHPNARDLAATWWADHHGPRHGIGSLFAARFHSSAA
jgi:hypothetical protein